jgi:ribosomal protein S18 acetylase RimI-like enzyme
MKRARGIGNGTKMMDLIMSLLKEKGSCGVHLEMSSKNKSALRFYLKIGFEILENLDETLILGKVL